MDLFEAIKKRRSVKKRGSVQALVKTDISMVDLEKIADAGRRAPSGNNAQPREFIIITDPDIIGKLGIVQGIVGEASAVIAIVADDKGSKYWLEDISASAENMLLAIIALGYDSCWTEGALLPKEKEVKEILGVPADKRLVIFLPIGEAASSGSQASKKPLTEVVYYDSYGRKKEGAVP